MKIKTKFNAKETIYFLTANQDYLDNNEKKLKIGEIFVCKAEIRQIDIQSNYDESNDIIYSVYIRVNNGRRLVRVHEDFCASDLMYLGLDVINKYYKSGEKNNKI